MPREDRRITFSNAELQKALVAHCLRRKASLPSGQITSVSPSPEPNGDILLTIHNEQQGKSYSVGLQPEFIAAALIYYCKGANVPIPRRAAKSLSVSGDNICLQILLPEQLERHAFVIHGIEAIAK